VNQADPVFRPGARLGHYEVLAAIGKGGMGEVWSAHDTVLDRPVALKTLPDALATDADRLARLEREARLLAALSHPNIAAIHGLETLHGVRFLVLELIDGPTLEDRIQRGPMRTDEALKLALQMAEALEAAHERGIVHRDLKPANVKVTPDGRVKVLDFGLAKALDVATEETLTYSPGQTRPGVVMGTPAYMSPEQARGEVVGSQTDIFAFGTVLYELLTGISPFRKKSSAETLARVLDTQPDLDALRSDVPPVARRLVRRCLEKDVRRRLQHMGDARADLEESIAALGSPASDVPAAPRRQRWSWAAALAAVALAAVAGWTVGARSPAPPAGLSVIRLSIDFPERRASRAFGNASVAIAPDGSRVAYVSDNRVWIRELGQKEPVAIVSSPYASYPFFSPDGQWVGVFGDGALIKVPVRGGTVVPLASRSDRACGAAWGPDGTIVYATTEGLYRVSADGGDSRVLAVPDRARGESVYAWPQFLPDGGSILLTVVSATANVAPEVLRLDLTTLERRRILTGGAAARYVATGHLLYALGSRLLAVPFDLASGTVRGDAVPLPDVDLPAAIDNGAADFALSTTGTLVTAPLTPPRDQRTLVWIDRQGKEEPLAVGPQFYGYPRVSPDGRQVAVERTANGNRDIWILNLDRLTQTQLTDSPAEDLLPVWAPDGRRLWFGSNRGGNFDIYSQAPDGASAARLEMSQPEVQFPEQFTPDGARLIVAERFKDLGVFVLSRPGEIMPLLHSEFEERLAKVSPDGRWVVYESDESGKQFEIFVRSFPDVTTRREKVSLDGGRYPLWGPKGSNQLYYVSLDGKMMAASVTLSPQFAVRSVATLFGWRRPPPGRSGMPYDVSPVDGRFIATRELVASPTGPASVSIALNWTDNLRRLVPAR
jgi:serine/threonine-protein kinase